MVDELGKCKNRLDGLEKKCTCPSVFQEQSKMALLNARKKKKKKKDEGIICQKKRHWTQNSVEALKGQAPP